MRVTGSEGYVSISLPGLWENGFYTDHLLLIMKRPRPSDSSHLP